MTQHKFQKGQRVYLTGGPNGDRKIPGEVVEGPDSADCFRVRIDGPHGVYDGDAFDGWGVGASWLFRPDGSTWIDSNCRIIPADETTQDPDYASQWQDVQAFAKERGVEVPDLPEPEDPDLVALREAIRWIMRGEEGVRAKYEGEG